MLSPLKVRIVASAVITKVDRGEGEINTILDGYGLAGEDRDLVVAEVIAKRPDIAV